MLASLEFELDRNLPHYTFLIFAITWRKLNFHFPFSILEQVACLRGHTGLVKGVTWDPVGKYLASQVKTHMYTTVSLKRFLFALVLLDRCLIHAGQIFGTCMTDAW